MRRAYEDLAVGDDDGVRAHALAVVADGLPGAQVEAPLVQRARHGAVGEQAVGQRPAAVRARVVEGVPALRGVEDGDPAAVHRHRAALAERHVLDPAHGDHATTGASRSVNWRGWYGSSRSSHGSRTAALATRRRSTSAADSSGSSTAARIALSPKRGTKS